MGAGRPKDGIFWSNAVGVKQTVRVGHIVGVHVSGLVAIIRRCKKRQ